MWTAHSTVILFIELAAAAGNHLSSQGYKPTMSVDKRDNLIVAATACAPGVTVGALHQARETGSHMVVNAARQAMRERGWTPLQANATVAELQVEIATLGRGDGQTCVDVVLFVPHRFLVTGPPEMPVVVETGPDRLPELTPKSDTEPASSDFWKWFNAIVDSLYGSAPAQIFSMLASLVTVLGTALGVYFHATIVRHVRRVVLKFRHRNDV